MNTEQIIEIQVDQQYTVTALVPDQMNLVAEISVIPASSIAYLDGLQSATESARDMSVAAANDSKESSEWSYQQAEESDVSARESLESANQSALSAEESQNDANHSEKSMEASESAAEQAEIERQKSEEAATASAASQVAAEASEQAAGDSEVAAQTARTGAEAAESGAVTAETLATEAQRLAESARDSSQRAQVSSETAQDKSEQAQALSETARNSSIQAKDNSAASAAAGEVSRQAAVVAQGKSETAQSESELAQGASETARTGSERAQGQSETAQAASEQSATESDTSKQKSVTAQSASESAQSSSEAAQQTSETAQRASETARDTSIQKASDSSASAVASEHSRLASLTAQGKAEDAQRDSDTAQRAAELSETNAKTSQTAASASASSATSSKSAAASSASASEVSKVASGQSANASQSARVASETARNQSQKWADNPYNAPVETSKYSARHWSDQARQYTETMTNGMFFMGSWDMGHGLPPTPTDHRVPWYRIVSSTNVKSIAYSTATPGDQLCWDPQNLEWFIIDTTDQVSIVNGQVGIVDLDADDVDARADNWVPSWSQVTGKPSTYKPSTHNHPWSQVTGAPATATRWPQWGEITGSPDEFPPADHTHAWSQISSKPAQATRWPAWNEVTSKPSTFTPSSHTHSYLPLSGGTVTGTITLSNTDLKLPDSSSKGIRTSTGGRAMNSTDGNLSIGDSYEHERVIIHGNGTNHSGFSYYFSGVYHTVWHEGNDGSGSGLDADTVDGIQASQLLRNDQNNTVYGSIKSTDPISTGDWDTPFENCFIQSSEGKNAPQDIPGWFWGISTGHTSNHADYRYGLQLVVENNSQHRLFYRQRSADGSGDWRQIFNDNYHPNADKVGGITPDKFVRYDVNQPNNVSISGGVIASQGTNTKEVTPTDLPLGFSQGYADGTTTLPIQYSLTTTFKFNENRAVQFVSGKNNELFLRTGDTAKLNGWAEFTQVYTESYKPSASDVGAVASNGSVVMTGNLAVTKGTHSNGHAFFGQNSSLGDAEIGINGHWSRFKADGWFEPSAGVKIKDGKVLVLGDSGDFSMWHDGTNNVFRSYKHGATTYFQGEDAGGTNRTMIQYDPDNYVYLMYAGGSKFLTQPDGTRTQSSGHTVHKIVSTGTNSEHSILEMISANGKSMRWTNTGTQMTFKDGTTTIAAIDGSGIDFRSKYLISSYGSSTNVDYITHDDGTKYGCPGRWKFNSDSAMNKGLDDIGNSLLSAGGIEFNSYIYLKPSSSTARTLDIASGYGYVRIGANNTNYAHFYTDRAKFYFDKEMRVKGEIYAGSGYNQRVFHDAFHPNADKLTTARTLGVTLTGDASGSATQTFDGTANKTISVPVVVNNDSHYHSHSTVSGVYRDEGKLARLLFPHGATYQEPVMAVTGAIKITLPVSWTNTMMTLRVCIYDYAVNESVELFLSGYSYSASAVWLNCTAKLLTTQRTRQYKVRFGHDGTKCCIFIGDTNTGWTHPCVTVMDCLLAFSNEHETNWDNGWAIGRVTSLPGNIDVTISTTQVTASDSDMLGGLKASSFVKTSDYSTGVRHSPVNISMSSSSSSPTAIPSGASGYIITAYITGNTYIYQGGQLVHQGGRNGNSDSARLDICLPVFTNYGRSLRRSGSGVTITGWIYPS